MGLRDIGTVKDTTVITILDPRNGKPLTFSDGTPMTITVYGPYSAPYKAIIRSQQKQRMADTSRAAMRGVLDLDEIDAMSRDLAIRCVKEWDLSLTGDDKLPFSPDAVADLFDEFPFVRDQVAATLGSVADFLEPPKSS